MTIDECRSFYAEEVRFAANLKLCALIEAMARVPREHFLGPRPWQIGSAEVGMCRVAYQATEEADPRHVHHNVATSHDLSNGQPLALVKWILLLPLELRRIWRRVLKPRFTWAASISRFEEIHPCVISL